MTTIYAIKDAGTPLVIKVLTFRYLLPNSSVIDIAVTLGNPLDAKPIPLEANNAIAKSE